MTRWQVIRLVAGREIRERLRSKGFRISTAVTLALILAAAILPAVLRHNGPTTYDIGVYGAQADQLAARLPEVAPLGDNVAVRVRRLADAAEGERLVSSGAIDAALGDGRVLVKRSLGNRLGFVVDETNRQVVGEAALGDAGVGGATARRILVPKPLDVRALKPKSKTEADRQALVFVGTILLYGQLLGFGYWVASGVVEEKVSRVVEVLLAKAPPAQLLAGKVIGIGAVGLLQLIAFVVLGLSAAAVAGSVDLPPQTVPVAAQVLVWFVLGFGLYSCLFAVGGAIASRVEELQSTTTPLTFVAMGSLFAAINAGGNPSGAVAKVATFIPFSAPMVLPIRVAAGDVGAGTVLGSVAIVLVTIAGVMALAARVYATGALHLRGQLKLRTALRAGRQEAPAGS